MASKYKAFISYKHDDKSQRLATALESELKSFARPIFARPLRIFRDEHYITPTPDLPKTIENALNESEFLIYIATKDAAQSKWVQKELNYWVYDLKRIENLIILLVDGEIINEKNLSHLDWDLTDAIPKPLRAAIDSIPFYLDLREIDVEDFNIKYSDFRVAVKIISAAFRGIDPNDIDGEEIKVYRRNSLIKNSIIILLLILLLVVMALTIIYFKQKTNAIHQKDQTKLLLANQYIASDKWPEALTIIGDSIKNSKSFKNDPDLNSIFANRAQQFHSIDKVLLQYSAPNVLKWKSKYYFLSAQYKLFLLKEEKIDFWSFNRESSILFTISDLSNANIINFYEVATNSIRSVNSIKELKNYKLHDFYYTNSSNFLLIRIGASIHEQVLGSYQDGFALININLGEVVFVPGKLCDYYISFDSKYLRVTCNDSFPKSDNIYELAFSHDENAFKMSYMGLSPTTDVVKTKWVSKNDKSNIELKNPQDFSFPDKIFDYDFYNWSICNCDIEKIKWEKQDVSHEEGLSGFQAWRLDFDMHDNYSLFFDPGGTCGRHYNIFKKSKSGKDEIALIEECVDGFGPMLFSNDRRYLLLSYEPSRSDFAFTIWDFKNEREIYPQFYDSSKVKEGFAAFSQDNKNLFILTDQGVLWNFEISSENIYDCECKTDEAFDGTESCVKPISKFHLNVEDGLENAEYPANINALYHAEDKIVVVSSKLVAVFNANTGREVWRTERIINAKELSDISISDDGSIIAILREEQLGLHLISNGIKLVDSFFLERLSQLDMPDSEVDCSKITHKYASTVFSRFPGYQLSDYKADFKNMFWLHNGDLCYNSGGRLFIRSKPTIKEYQLNNLKKYTGLYFKNGIKEIDQLPTSEKIDYGPNR